MATKATEGQILLLVHLLLLVAAVAVQVAIVKVQETVLVLVVVRQVALVMVVTHSLLVLLLRRHTEIMAVQAQQERLVREAVAVRVLLEPLLPPVLLVVATAEQVMRPQHLRVER